MEFPDMSQSRYSWPPMPAQCGSGSTDILRAVHSPVRSGSTTGLLSPATRKYSISCGDLRDAVETVPFYWADRGAQGDGPHIQNRGITRPRKFSFWEEMQCLAHKCKESDPKEKYADTEMSGVRDSSTTSPTHRYSDKEFQSMNVFLKSFDLNDADVNTKKSEKIIIDAIKAGMFLESKRKVSHLLDKRASGSTRGVAASDELEKSYVEAEGDDKKASPPDKQRRRFQGALSKGILGDTPERGNTLNDDKTLAITANSHRVTNCEESCHEKPKYKNNNVTFANDGDISSDDFSHYDTGNDNIQLAIDEKVTYQGRGGIRHLLENQTMLRSGVFEDDNVSSCGQSGNEKGKRLQKNKSKKRTLASNSPSATTYRVELVGKQFNGKVVGRMIVTQEGESMPSEHGFDGEVTLVAPSGKWSSAEDSGGSLIGKVFTIKVVALESDQTGTVEPDSQNKTDAKETRNVKGIKQSRDPGNNDSSTSTVPPDCELCMVKFTSAQHAKVHYGGKAHQRRVTVSAGAEFSCDACNVIYTSQKHAEQHVLGRKHRNMVACSTEPVVETPVEVPQDIPPIGESLVCQVCNITTNSRQNLIDHFNGAKHLKKLNASLKESHGEENTEQNLSYERLGNNANRLMDAISKGIQPTCSGTATLDVPTNFQGPRADGGPRWVARNPVANEQACHSGQSTSHVPMPITFQVPKSKFNLSNLKMARTVGTQFTNTNSVMLGRDLTCQEKLPRRNQSMLESNSCRGNTHCADAPYCACDPTPEGFNMLRGSVADWRQPSYKQQAGSRKFKKRSGAL